MKGYQIHNVNSLLHEQKENSKDTLEMAKDLIIGSLASFITIKRQTYYLPKNGLGGWTVNLPILFQLPFVTRCIIIVLIVPSK
jgi:hypothetical protein